MTLIRESLLTRVCYALRMKVSKYGNSMREKVSLDFWTVRMTVPLLMWQILLSSQDLTQSFTDLNADILKGFYCQFTFIAESVPALRCSFPRGLQDSVLYFNISNQGTVVFFLSFLSRFSPTQKNLFKFKQCHDCQVKVPFNFLCYWQPI